MTEPLVGSPLNANPIASPLAGGLPPITGGAATSSTGPMSVTGPSVAIGGLHTGRSGTDWGMVAIAGGVILAIVAFVILRRK
jgi:hypothetical protein